MENNFGGLEFGGLDKALLQRNIIKIFCSNSGLRIVKIEKNSSISSKLELKGYGEHINLIPALFTADTNYQKGEIDHCCLYYTGSPKYDSHLDWLICYCGKNIKITRDEEGVKASTFFHTGHGKTFAAALRDLNNWISKQNKKELIYNTFLPAD